MKVAFRTDASFEIGTGHVMRCLALAKALRDQGAICYFICREHPGNLLDYIYQQGFEVYSLPLKNNSQLNPNKESEPLEHLAWLGTNWLIDASDTSKVLIDNYPGWLAVDHYSIDFRWEKAIRSSCRQLMVIDDLANRSHDCDLLLDQNLGRSPNDYKRLLPFHAIKLIGPQYALLRPEFAKLRAQSLARRIQPELKHLLITMGGVDKDNITGLTLKALEECSLPSDMNITVVMGSNAPWLGHIQSQASEMKHPTQVLVGVGDMAKLMTTSDLSIGAAGGTSWERCCLGVPSFVIITAENQRAGAIALKQKGAAMIVDDPKDIQEKLMSCFESSDMLDQLLSLSHSAASITDGYGVSRVIREGLFRYA
jgi:UDP-2,4-diacetamido-2,4,6-trideoxy-beta-L-altropyranose hydrolase